MSGDSLNDTLRNIALEHCCGSKSPHPVISFAFDSRSSYVSFIMVESVFLPTLTFSYHATPASFDIFYLGRRNRMSF